MRVLGASVLALEAIVVILAIPVVIVTGTVAVGPFRGAAVAVAARNSAFPRRVCNCPQQSTGTRPATTAAASGRVQVGCAFKATC